VAVLATAAQAGKEKIEFLIAELAPKPDVPASVRKLPGAGAKTKEERGPSFQPSLLEPGRDASAPVSSSSISTPEEAASLPMPRVPRPIVQPLAPERYRVQFTIGQDTRDRLRRVQSLLRRQIPDGDTAAIFDRALRVLEEVEGKRLGFAPKPKRPRGEGGRTYENRIRPGTDKTHKDGSRHIPAAVKRAVWWRDAGRCAFVSDAGHRCTERSFLELHHIHPYALDGLATVSNISLRCRRHNQYEGETVFGSRAITGNSDVRVT
jgi:5-methylcytosine-specific restriction endonuclease McrA